MQELARALNCRNHVPVNMREEVRDSGVIHEPRRLCAPDGATTGAMVLDTGWACWQESFGHHATLQRPGHAANMERNPGFRRTEALIIGWLRLLAPLLQLAKFTRPVQALRGEFECVFDVRETADPSAHPHLPTTRCHGDFNCVRHVSRPIRSAFVYKGVERDPANRHHRKVSPGTSRPPGGRSTNRSRRMQVPSCRCSAPGSLHA